MVRATLPPTPAASTEIKGKPNGSLDQAEMTFTLPPSAVNDTSSAGTKDGIDDDEPAPISPTSPNPKAEGRPKQQNELSLPPPPSRSRKIIQMKPKAQPSQSRRSARADGQANEKQSGSEPAQQASGGKKGASGTSAAGRKVARKTAHSIIERRRRSKMNEEFGVLKDLIPACRGCEMHKLAILQASIDYLRYLEQCVADLKANQEQQDPRQGPSRPSSSMQNSAADFDASNDDESEDDMDVDLDEQETEVAPPVERDSSVSSTTGFTAITSPAFSAQSQQQHRASIATLPSPVFGPYYSRDSLRPSTTHSSHSYAGSRSSFSTQTSPNIPPEVHSLEHMEDLNEASTALLMLNAKDRRNTAGSLSSTSVERTGARSMSVKDLLRS